MEEKKNKKGILLIIFLVILLILCIGMGVFIFVNKDKLTTTENTKTTVETEKNKVDENTEAVENSEKCPTISYDLGTSDYGLSADGIGISVSVDKSRKSARISYNGATISQALGLGWMTAADTTTYELIDTKTFDKKIAQVLVDGSGQSSSSVAILYLMEDGTVEYVPILKEIKTNWGQTDNTKKFNSYGKLDGISEIISLVSADANQYHTVLAKKVDGTVIDLRDAFSKTGNF